MVLCSWRGGGNATEQRARSALLQARAVHKQADGDDTGDDKAGADGQNKVAEAVVLSALQQSRQVWQLAHHIACHR